MKFFVSALLYCALFACGNTTEPIPPTSPTGRTTVSGHVEGAAGQYVRLFYIPQLRGNLNPDGYRTKGIRTGADGNFSFSVDDVTMGGNYSLIMEDSYCHLVLFPGDDLYVELNSGSKSETIVATGKGAGKINFQRLDQVDYDYDHIMAAETAAEFARRADSVVEGQLGVLKAVYAGDLASPLVIDAVNRADLEKLMTETPLTVEEHNYLDQLLRFRRYGMTKDWLSHMAENPDVASLPVDFNSEAFRPFRSEEYAVLDQINDFQLANDLYGILDIEYIKQLAGRSDTVVTYGNWRSHFSPDFNDWASNYLQDNFSNDIHDAYFGALTGWMLTMGEDHRLYSERLDPAAGGDYAKRLAEFNRLLERGMRIESGYEADSLTLDKPELQALLDRHAGKELLINFWSAEFAGSSIVDNIPLMQDFEDRNRDEITVVNICIDSLRQKGLWAARIMDSGWDAEHYFVPIEGSEGLLDDFSSRNLATFCEGGATYSLVDAEGTIHRDIDMPFYKAAEQIARDNGAQISGRDLKY